MTANPAWDVCVVGAGPAGLSAAALLAEHGLRTVIVDEQPRAGGQYFRQVSPAVAARVGAHRPEGAALITRAERAGVVFRLGTSVWGVSDDGRGLLVSGPEVDTITARHIVVATGATERSLAFPGWTSPRVVTVGYAQHLAAEGVAVGQRVIVAGSGPFLLPVACSLVEVGARVVAVLEHGTPYRVSAATLATVRHQARIAEYLRYRARLARARVPVRSGRRVVQVNDAGASLTVRESTVAGGHERVHVVDALCVGYGFRPQVDLAALLGCARTVDPATGDQSVVVDADGRTDVARIWAAGEVAGVAGADRARAAGAVVAGALLASEGSTVDVSAHRRAATVATAFAATLADRYPAPRQLARTAVATLADDAIVCRCESVTAGTVRAAVEAGADIQAVKGSTRCGMGPCQGRECAPAVAALCGSDTAAFTSRAPLRPVPMSAIAAFGETMR